MRIVVVLKRKSEISYSRETLYEEREDEEQWNCVYVPDCFVQDDDLASLSQSSFVQLSEMYLLKSEAKINVS